MKTFKQFIKEEIGEKTNLYDIKTIIDDGQRAYRLRRGIHTYPKFDNPIYIHAWKAGYRAAMHRWTTDEIFKDFIKDIT